MSVIPVVFEDHSLTQFHPLTWSRPTFEMRVGMFCLRERLGQLSHDAVAKGILLGRPSLDGLQQAAGWAIGSDAAAAVMANQDSDYLWINGRVDWCHQQLAALRGRAESGKPVHIQDDSGLLAFTCSGAQARELCAEWSLWEASVARSGGWRTPGQVIPFWKPEISNNHGPAETMTGLKWIWEIVPRTSDLLSEDLKWAQTGSSWRREPHGVIPAVDQTEPFWAQETRLESWDKSPLAKTFSSEAILNSDNVWCGPEVRVGAGTSIDASSGPVILDRGVSVLPNCYLEGPLYLGPGSRVKAGAAIYGESSFGIGNRIAGEIGESTFGDFANKQHEGFIGHAVLGSWVNLGALTTCSDLKNNYGNVRVDLGAGPVDTGMRFVGLLLGDHAKTAIGTLFNTGTSVGFASNIFGGGMPPKYVGNFSWGGQEDGPSYGLDRALSTAEVVMSRRGCQLTEHHRKLFGELAS